MTEPWLGWRLWATIILHTLQAARPDERMLFLMRVM